MDARRFVDVAAEEIFGLVGSNEFFDGGAAEMLAWRGRIERGVFRRAVANEDEGLEIGKAGKMLGELCLGVFAGSVERSGVGAAEARDEMSGEFDAHGVQIMEAVSLGEAGDIGIRFVVAGEQPEFAGAFGKNGRGFFEAAAPIGEIARGDV